MLIASLVALIDAGPGELSIDAALGRDEWGPGWALGGLVLGAAASSAAIAMGKRAPTRSDASPESAVGQAATSDTAGDPTKIETN